MAHDVFVSYSSEDRLAADALCGALEAARIRCWIAPRDVVPALSYSGQITRAIRTSRVMVLIFSEHSNVSAAVLAEVELAANARIHILNFRVDDSPLGDDLRFYLQRLQWFDALTPPMEQHHARLVQTIESLLTPSSTAKEPKLRTPTTGTTRQGTSEIALVPHSIARRAGREWGGRHLELDRRRLLRAATHAHTDAYCRHTKSDSHGIDKHRSTDPPHVQRD